MRARLMSRHFDWWKTHGFEFDESAKTRAALAQQETFLKMFAVSHARLLNFILFSIILRILCF